VRFFIAGGWVKIRDWLKAHAEAKAKEAAAAAKAKSDEIEAAVQVRLKQLQAAADAAPDSTATSTSGGGWVRHYRSPSKRGFDNVNRGDSWQKRTGEHCNTSSSPNMPKPVYPRETGVKREGNIQAQSSI
jgi:hypothetical protein